MARVITSSPATPVSSRAIRRPSTRLPHQPTIRPQPTDSAGPVVSARDHLRAIRAERQPDRRFAPPQPRDPGAHRIQADDRTQRRQGRKDAEERRDETRTDTLPRDQRRQRLRGVQRQIAMHRADGPRHRRRDVQRRNPVASQDLEREIPQRRLGQRNIHFGNRVAAQRSPDVRRDADDAIGRADGRPRPPHRSASGAARSW